MTAQPQGRSEQQHFFPPEDEEPESMIAKPPAPSSKSFGSQLASLGRRIYQPIEDLFTGRWRLKRLYRDWSVHDALPPEEIPSDNCLKNSPSQAPTSATRVPPWLVLTLAAIAVILLFVAIGILIRRA